MLHKIGLERCFFSNNLASMDKGRLEDVVKKKLSTFLRQTWIPLPFTSMFGGGVPWSFALQVLKHVNVSVPQRQHVTVRRILCGVQVGCLAPLWACLKGCSFVI